MSDSGERKAVFSEIREISHALDRVEKGKISALAEGDKVLIMIQDAPAELRRLADAMERIGVQEIKAFVAYQKQERPILDAGLRDHPKKESNARNPEP